MAGNDEYHLEWKTCIVEGRKAAYGEAGAGEPLLFLHGWGLGQHSYKRAMKRLLRLDVRVIAPALPGFGGTEDLPKESFSMEGYGDWVASFLHAIGVVDPVMVVGHSFGGGGVCPPPHLQRAPTRLGQLDRWIRMGAKGLRSQIDERATLVGLGYTFPSRRTSRPTDYEGVARDPGRCHPEPLAKSNGSVESRQFGTPSRSPQRAPGAER